MRHRVHADGWLVHTRQPMPDAPHLAVPVARKTRHGIGAAALQRPAQDVLGLQSILEELKREGNLAHEQLHALLGKLLNAL